MAIYSSILAREIPGTEEPGITKERLNNNLACGISVSSRGIKPVPPRMEARSPNHWITREVPNSGFWMGLHINNLRYADDTTLMAESEEELECLDESERGEWKVGLKLNIQKTKLLASGPITSWQIDGKQWKHDRLYFLWLQNHCRWWLQPWN